jgi:acetoin utilization protein AcuB
MRLCGFRHLPVVNESGQLVGVVSDRDVQRAWCRGPDTLVASFMSRDIEFAHADAPAHEVAARMLRRKIGCLPIVDRQNHLLGIVTESDFLRIAQTVLAAG